jgi:outer membrane receptor for ferrienterochelin and colicins
MKGEAIMRTIITWTAVLAVVLFPCVATSGNLSSIRGRVIDDATGEPLASANVILKGTTWGAATGVDGRYLIANLPAGSYKVMASMVGREQVAKDVQAAPNQAVVQDFRLRERPIESGEIVVTATRTPRYIRDVPVRTEVLTRQAIEDRGACSLYEALEGAPGVTVEQQCQACNFSMVRLQGLGPDHAQILIDGQPIYSGLAGVYGLQQLGTGSVDRIEIVKGAGSALYGAGAVAGAINIVTTRPSPEPRLRLGVEMGDFETNRYHLEASGRRDNLGLTLFAERRGGDAIDQTRDGEDSDEVMRGDGISDRVRTDGTNAGFSVVVDTILGSDQLVATGRLLSELRQGGVLHDDAYENPFTEGTERILTDRQEAGVRYKRQFIPGNEVNVSFSYAHHQRNATNDTYLVDYMATHGDTLPTLDEMRPYLADEELYVCNLNYVHPLFGRHRFLAGIQYSHDALEESGKYVVVDEDDHNYAESYISMSEKRADEFGVYLQDEFAVSDAVEIVGGVRSDWHESEDNFRGSGKVATGGIRPVRYDESAVNPRFALKYRPLPFLTLRGSVGTGFRVPYGFSEDLHLCSGSPRVWKGGDLRPEKSASFTLSADYEARSVALSASFFRTNLQDKIAFVDADPAAESLGYTYEWMNIDDAYVQGIELTGRFALTRDLMLDADVTVNDGQYENERPDWVGTEYERDSRHVSRFPRYTAGIKANLTPSSWAFVLEGDLRGPMYIDYFADGEEPTKIKRTDPYLTVGAKVSRRLSERLTAFVGAKNLTGYIQPERHTDDAAFMYAPVYGRIPYAGLALDVGY